MKITMSQPATERRTSWLLLFCSLFIAALASRLCYLFRPFDSDGSMFIYMGKLVSEGGRFGTDFVDNKFPTVGLMMSARAGGCWGRTGGRTCCSAR